MLLTLVECEVCAAMYNPRSFHHVPEHDIGTGFPNEGLYPICPYCGRISTTKGTQMDESHETAARSLQYGDGEPYPVVAKYPRSKGLVKPFVAFRTNVQHLKFQREIPIEVCWLARLWQGKKDEELLARFGSLGEREIPQGEERDNFDNAFAKRIGDWFTNTSEGKQREFKKRYGPTIVNDVGKREMYGGLYSILTALVSGALTAFETLAGPLDCRA